MKKIFLLSVFVLIMLFSVSGCGGAESSDSLSRAELFDKTAQKTVLINASGLTGSGIIAKSKDGNVDIITNYHVIMDAYGAREPVSVKFYNSDEFITAEIIGFVESCDVAVLRVAYAQAVQTFDFSSGAEKVGDSILAVGYNNGQIGAYDGIISTLSKHIYSKSLKSNMLVTQTTAPFAEGCSGGAVIDSSGNLVGLSSYVLLTNNGGDDMQTGISYAIPQNIVLSAYECTVDIGTFPAMPATGFNVNPDYSVTVMLSNYLFHVTEGKSGLLVSDSRKGTIANGSIITKINGIKLDTVHKMTIFLSELMRTYNDTVFTLS